MARKNPPPKSAAPAIPQTTTTPTPTLPPTSAAPSITVTAPKRIGEIFQDAQKTAVHFRKCRAALRKVQEDCVLNGCETEFNDIIIRVLNRTLTHKKKEPEIDRVINFMAGYLKYASELDLKGWEKSRKDLKNKKKRKVLEEEEEGEEERNEEENEEEDDELPPPTPTTNLAERIITFYSQGLKASDKLVRGRVVQIMAATMVHLGPIEEGLYKTLRKTLAERLLDKEALIRASAAQALAPLQGDDSTRNPDKLVDKMLDSLQHDPSHEVRKTILKGIVQNPRTLPSILTRCRDSDSLIRKEVYQRNMVEYKGFLEMTITQREQLLKCGLSDREEAVSQACLNMLSDVWLPQIDGNLIELLEKLDVMNNDVAELALKAYFKAHPDFWKGFKFPDNFWEHLGIESAFLAKVLITFVHAEEDFDKLDEILPSASRMASLIKEQCNVTTSCVDEDLRIDNDFIMVQLLEITKLHDFADEAGRRRVFDILRKLFIQIDANDDQIKVMVAIIRKLSNDELDFTRTMVEIQSDILEEVNSAFEAVSFRDIEDDLEVEEKKDQHRDFLNAAYKCLLTSKHMLRLCEMTIEKNVMLSGVLNDLIYPASKCNIDVLHDVGTECLGLCCMLDKNLAHNNFQHFTYMSNDDDQEVRLASLKIAMDLCAIYGVSPTPFTISTNKIYEFFKASMRSDDGEFLAVATQGISKLFLAGILDEPKILASLIQLYFIPATIDNLKLRQGLHYFLEVYASFSPVNQAVLAKAFTPTLIRLAAVYKKYSAKFPMVTPFQIGQQLADWTNPNKAAEPTESPHAAIAIDLLKEAFAADETNRKLLFQVISKLAVDSFTSPVKLLCISKLLAGFNEKCVYPDNGTRNISIKFAANIAKQIEAHCPELEPDQEMMDDKSHLDPEVEEISEWLLAQTNDATPKRASAGPRAASKRQKVKRMNDSSDEDASYAP